MNRNAMVSALLVGLALAADGMAQPDRGDPQGRGGPPKGGVAKGPAGGVSGGFAPFRTAWEYKAMPLTHDAEALNKLGAEGWELVAIDPKNPGQNSLYVFKRPAPGRFGGQQKGFIEKKKEADAPKREGPEPKKGFSTSGFGGTGFGGTIGGQSGFGSTFGQPTTTGTFGRGTGAASTTTGFSFKPPERKEPAKREIRLIRLKNADAIELLKVVRPFIEPSAILVPDPRTNSLVLASDAATFEQIQRLVIALDEPEGKR